MRENVLNRGSTVEIKKKLPQSAQSNCHVTLVSVAVQWTWSSVDEFEKLKAGAVSQCSQERFDRCVLGERAEEPKVQRQSGQISKGGRGPTDRKSTQVKDGKLGEWGSGVPRELRCGDVRLREFEARYIGCRFENRNDSTPELRR